MIASNFRKHPEAMALQLVLKLGRPVWNGQRPTTRAGRAMRAARAALVASTAQVVAWVKVPAPSWWKAQQGRAKALAAKIKAACIPITWELIEVQGPELGETVAGVINRAKTWAAANKIYTDQFDWAFVMCNKYEITNWQHYGTGKDRWPAAMHEGYRG